MPLFYASINSGSNGNCYYVGNQQHAVLVDAGISCREIERRLNKLQLDVKKIRAIFISHEHSDHIRGVEVLSKKHRIPVYINEGTLNEGRLQIREELVRPLADIHWIEDLEVNVFGKFHDAADPVSFTVSHGDWKVGVITDIGYACANVMHHFSSCHAAFLEANYDEDMLMNGNYPWHLKRRISSQHGHLSNKQALDLFLQHRSPELSHLILSHLSRENNDPALVASVFQPVAGDVRIDVASRYEASELFAFDRVELPSQLKMELDI